MEKEEIIQRRKIMKNLSYSANVTPVLSDMENAFSRIETTLDRIASLDSASRESKSAVKVLNSEIQKTCKLYFSVFNDHNRELTLFISWINTLAEDEKTLMFQHYVHSAPVEKLNFRKQKRSSLYNTLGRLTSDYLEWRSKQNGRNEESKL